MKGTGTMVSIQAASKLVALTALWVLGCGTSAAAQVVRQVGVLITAGPKCPHHMAPNGHKLEKDKDSLGWGIMNVCGQDQKVLLCVYKDGMLKNPFAPCESSVPNADVGRVFVVPSRAFPVTTLTCLATGEPGMYSKVAFTGADVPAPNPVCPSTIPATKTPPKGVDMWTHRLGVEIIP